VNQYAAAMYAPTANAASDARPARTTPRITINNPKVATNSPTQSDPDDRVCVDTSTAEMSNITFATMQPNKAPSTCTTMYTPASRFVVPPSTRSASVTTGLKWAPEIGPNA